MFSQEKAKPRLRERGRGVVVVQVLPAYPRKHVLVRKACDRIVLCFLRSGSPGALRQWGLKLRAL